LCLDATAAYTAAGIAMNAADQLLVEDALARHGARTALVCGARTFSYAELAAEMARAANALRRALASGRLDRERFRASVDRVLSLRGSLVRR